MQGRRGPRLPIGPPPDPPLERCLVDERHGKAIRFQLVRFHRPVGTVLLCGDCFLRANAKPDPDPLHVEAA
jgi:hypothetical protein